MELSKLDDVKLVLFYKEGSEEAFAELLHRHKSRVYTSIYMIVKDHYIAEDIMQEVFIKVIKQIKSDQYNEQGKFLPWILRIAHNMAIDHFRKKKRYPVITFDNGDPITNTMDFAEMPEEDRQVKKEMHAQVRDLIKRLPNNQKQVLIMRHYMDLSFQEIAEQSGVSINTALGRMRYALINLRKKLKQINIAYDQIFYDK